MDAALHWRHLVPLTTDADAGSLAEEMIEALGRMWGHQESRALAAYVCVTVVFWLLVWITGGGTDHLHLPLTGPVINVVLLLLLAHGSYLALGGLALEAFAVGALIGLGGFPPFGPAFGLLAVFPVAQILCLGAIARADHQAVPGRA